MNSQSEGEDKVHPITGHEGPEGKHMNSSTLPSTSALDGVGGQRQASAVLPSAKTQYPLYRRLGGTQSRSGRVRKISPSPGFDSRTVQLVASSYTDYTIPALILNTIYRQFAILWQPSLEISSSLHTHILPAGIQGDSGGICNTLGNDIMCDSK